MCLSFEKENYLTLNFVNMADDNKESRMSIDNFDFAQEGATHDASKLVNELVFRLHQAMSNPSLQGEVHQQLHTYGILSSPQKERVSERYHGETSKRGLSMEEEDEQPFYEGLVEKSHGETSKRQLSMMRREEGEPTPYESLLKLLTSNHEDTKQKKPFQ